MSGYWDRRLDGKDDETERLEQRIKDLEQYRVGAEAHIAELEELSKLVDAWYDASAGTEEYHVSVIALARAVEVRRGTRRPL
jgi:hypothetical protein